MAQNALWKVPDGAGGYTAIHPETTAKMVKYGNATVEDFLDNVPTANTSNFMRGLLTAEDADSVRAVLGIDKEDFFDETGGRWYSVNAQLTTDLKKFGDASTYLSGTSYLLRNNVTLGGKDFTISGWYYSPSAKTATSTVFSWGNTSNYIYCFVDVNNHFTVIVDENGSHAINVAVASRTTTFTVGQWNHLELDYRNSDNTVFLFFNGGLVLSGTGASFSTARSYPFRIGCNVSGSAFFSGYVDEFCIQEQLMHAAAFTVPPAPNNFSPATTLALLHFGIDKISDETGAFWYNSATLSTAQKKFGTKSLYCTGKNLQRMSSLKLGGKDFTIAGWFYAPATKTTTNTVFSWGQNSTGRLQTFIDSNNHISFNLYVNGTYKITFEMSDETTSFTTGQWNHVELDYRNSDGAFFLFFNGTLAHTGTDTSLQTARTLPFVLGGNLDNPEYAFDGYIDNFLITNQLLHDADFTVPSDPYTADDKTLALFNFEDN